MVIFFHGQGGPEEATPANHRAWIDHMVKQGAVVVYPRYEQDYAASVLGSAIAGVKTANEKLGKPDLPVLAIGYSRGGALAVEYAAASAGKGAPVPDIIESINTVSFGEQTHPTDLRPLAHNDDARADRQRPGPARRAGRGRAPRAAAEGGLPRRQHRAELRALARNVHRRPSGAARALPERAARLLGPHGRARSRSSPRAGA